jgi:hypothetical protein
MLERARGWFIWSAAVILFMTAAAKLVSAADHVPTLMRMDPVLNISNRHFFLLAGLLELAVSAFLLTGRNDRMKLMLIAWLATNFALYRAGLWWNHSAHLCSCLGNLAEMIPIRPRLLDGVLWGALGWMGVGSYGFLLLGWCVPRKSAASQAAAEARQKPAGI